MVLRVGGLASGIDVDTLVKDLMKAERLPLDKLEREKQLTLWKQEDYREINNALRDLRDETFTLKLQGTFMTKAASSSDTTVAAVTAGGTATQGIYDVEINALARGVQVMSSAALDEETGPGGTRSLAQQFGLVAGQAISFTIEGAKKADGSFATAQIDLTTDDTVYTLVSKINAATDADGTSLGLQASYDGTYNRLVIVSKKTGADQHFEISVDSTLELASGGNTNLWSDKLKITSGISNDGQNSEFKIAGSADWLQAASNSVSILGLNLDLKQQGTTTINVSLDTDTVFNAVKGWVDKYNEVLSELNGKLTEKRYRDYPPLSVDQKKDMSDNDVELWEEKARSGLLANDQMSSGILSDIRLLVSSSVDGLSGSYSTMSSLGITTGSYSERGKLYIDEAKLRQALQEDPDGVMEFFTNNGSSGDEGLAVQLYEEISTGISSLSDHAGTTSDFSLVDNSFMGKQLTSYTSRIRTLEERLLQVEDRYWRQFTAMERAINQMNAQSAWLSQQFGTGGSS